MNLAVEAKGKFRNSRNTGMLVTLLLVLLTATLLTGCAAIINSDSAILDSTSHVGSEKELRNAVNTINGPTVIVLTADIALTDSALSIPEGREITLISDNAERFWKLIGTNNQATISVNGILTLDRIIVTHVKDATDSGIRINGGKLILLGGEISGNTVNGSGGGVLNIDGSFLMMGGIITNNTATGCGGGVYNIGGSFSMMAGTIINNAADVDGGGVYNRDGTFSMSGGTISDNSAIDGGGVCLVDSNFTMSIGKITRNTAGHWGGGVCMIYSTFSMSGSEISGNIAGRTGGGVFNLGISGNFTLSGGKIFKNTVLYVTESDSKDDIKKDISAGAGVGGGVSLDYGGIFDLRGGVIFGNTASNGDGNVHKHGGNMYYFGAKESTVICMGITLVTAVLVVAGVIAWILRKKSKIHTYEVRSKFKVCNSRNTWILIALLIGVLFSSLLAGCVFMMNSKDTILDGAIHVRNEKELRNAVDIAV